MIEYKKGDIILCTVTGIKKYGAFVKIDEEHNGLIHISQISGLFIKDINEYLKIGDQIKAEVLENSTNCRKVKLGTKNILEKNYKRKTYIKETKSGFNTLKRLLNTWVDAKLEEKIQKSKKFIDKGENT